MEKAFAATRSLYRQPGAACARAARARRSARSRSSRRRRARDAGPVRAGRDSRARVGRRDHLQRPRIDAGYRRGCRARASGARPHARLCARGRPASARTGGGARAAARGRLHPAGGSVRPRTRRAALVAICVEGGSPTVVFDLSGDAARCRRRYDRVPDDATGIEAALTVLADACSVSLSKSPRDRVVGRWACRVRSTKVTRET